MAEEPGNSSTDLREILAILRVATQPMIKGALESTLSDSQRRLAYHHSDGISQREVGQKVGKAQNTISMWWSQWAKIGLMHLNSDGRLVRSFDIEAYGLEMSLDD